MNLGTVRDDLKARLATISGLQTYDTIPAKPEVPCAIVRPSSATIHATFERGSTELRFDILVLVQAAHWPSAQDALDGYLAVGAAGSLIDAVEAFSTGQEDMTVESWDNYDLVQVGESQFGSVTLHVSVPMSS
jgi:hypothetical protein